METLKCFECQVNKPLDNFSVNRRHYQIKAYKGRCMVCQKCSLFRALETLKLVRFSFEDNKFIVIEFKDANEVIEFFKNENNNL